MKGAEGGGGGGAVGLIQSQKGKVTVYLETPQNGPGSTLFIERADRSNDKQVGPSFSF